MLYVAMFRSEKIDLSRVVELADKFFATRNIINYTFSGYDDDFVADFLDRSLCYCHLAMLQEVSANHFKVTFVTKLAPNVLYKCICQDLYKLNCIYHNNIHTI